jgi:hypothetical protein
VIVTKTEPCHECGEDHHTTPDVITETISVCRRLSTTKSITPFTSGTHTYLISSCHPMTMWYTHNVTEEACQPPRTFTECAISTAISTRVIYHNGTGAAPVSFVTVPGNASTIRLTLTRPASTVVSPTTAYITETSYASGKIPTINISGFKCGQWSELLLSSINITAKLGDHVSNTKLEHLDMLPVL